MSRVRFCNWRDVAKVGDPALPFAVISLEESRVRRERLKLNGMPDMLADGFWPALDARSFDRDDLDSLVDLASYDRLIGGLPRRGRAGNAISQRDAMSFMLQGRSPLMGIFEDDACPVVPNAFEILSKLLEPLYAYAEEGAAFICHLGVQRRQRNKCANLIVRESKNLVSGPSLIRDAGAMPRIWRSHAFIVSREAAKRIVAGETPLRTGADDFLQRYQLGYFERFFFVEPGLFFQDESTPSTLEASLTASRTDSRSRMARLGLKGRLRRMVAEQVSLDF